MMKNDSESFTVWRGLFLGEFCALLIALATTVLPTKTGSKYGIAGHFFEEPTFLQEFVVNFVGVHAVFILLAVVVVIWCWKSGAGGSSISEE